MKKSVKIGNTKVDLNTAVSSKAAITEATTKELVAFYNEYAEKIGNKVVKKFANRATAEKRAASLVQDLGFIYVAGTHECPHCKTNLDNGYVTDEGNGGYEVNGEFIKLGHEHVCLACGEEFGKKIGGAKGGSGNNSAGIAKSWENADVAAKRSQRSAVEVDEVYYGSVRKAYIALGLDLKDHIQFRMLLKETGKQTVDGRNWKIVPLNYDK